jgi:hypothetical protein
LAAECGVFTAYLLGGPAPHDVVAAYTRAHALGVIGTTPASMLDRAALATARRGPVLARAADAFVAFAARGGLLRQKVVLLVAILESRGDTADRIDTAQPGSIAGFFAEAAVRGLFTLSLAAAAAVVIVPLAGWYVVTGAPRAQDGDGAR